MASDSDEENSVPWAYIYLYSSSIVEKGNNQMVPASKISNFDYNLYRERPNVYKNTPMKYRPGGRAKNRQCVIHIVKETKAELEFYVESQIQNGKRFPIPKLKENLSNLSNDNKDSRTDLRDDRNEEDPESSSSSDNTLPVSPKKGSSAIKRKRNNVSELDSSLGVADVVSFGNDRKAAKKKRKKNNSDKKKTVQKVNESIVGKYVTASRNKTYPPEVRDDENAETHGYGHVTASTSQDITYPQMEDTNSETYATPAMSSPPPVTVAMMRLQMQEMERKHAAAIRAYKMQLEVKNQELKELQERQSTVGNDLISSEADVKTILSDYDKKFHRHFILHDEAHAKEVTEEDKNFVILRKGVKCKQKAYVDAFMQKSPSQFVIMLSVGIYGREDLSNRCRRQQKDTKDKKPLDDINTQVINEEFYHFLRMKGYTLAQIEHNLNKVNDYHRNAITSSISSVKHDKKKKEAEEAERVLEDLQRQGRENPLADETEQTTS